MGWQPGLRLLAGLEQPTRGSVVRTAAKGETAVVFQAPTLAPWLTAEANVALPLELAGAAPAHADLRAATSVRTHSGAPAGDRGAAPEKLAEEE